MCRGQQLKSTGDKRQMVSRLVSHYLEAKKGKMEVHARLQSTLGPVTSTDGPSSQLRRFYADNFSLLDRVDRLWYEMRFIDGPKDWESHFIWSLVHNAIINARAA